MYSTCVYMCIVGERKFTDHVYSTCVHYLSVHLSVPVCTYVQYLCVYVYSTCVYRCLKPVCTCVQYMCVHVYSTCVYMCTVPECTHVQYLGVHRPESNKLHPVPHPASPGVVNLGTAPQALQPAVCSVQCAVSSVCRVPCAVQGVTNNSVFKYYLNSWTE